MEMKKINLGLIVDRSGSVINEKYSLNKSIDLLLESLKRKYNKSIKFNIVVGIYGGEDDLLLPSIKEENITIEKVEKENEDIFKSIIFISDILLEREGEKIIILFSDGYYNDDNWRERILQIQEKELKDIKRISIGVGEGYYKEALISFSSNKEVYKYEDIYDLF